LITLQYNEVKSTFQTKGLYSAPKPTLNSYNGDETDCDMYTTNHRLRIRF